VEAFTYKNGRLHCEGVDLHTVADGIGTPAYVYSAAAFVERFSELDRAFAAVPHLVCYSAKANGNLAVLRLLVEAGAGVDIVSGGELHAARRAGADPARIVFAGVGKSTPEIQAALEAGILFFTVESGPELERISAVADRLGAVGRFAIRVNPDVEADTHKYVVTGTARNKFGVDLDRAAELYRRSLDMPGVEPVGVHMHVGSQLMTPDPYVKAIARIAPLVEDVERRGTKLTYFDIGGGYGIRYDAQTPDAAEQFAAAIIPAVEPLDMTIVLEPGRYIAGNAGILLTRVEYMKRTPGKTFAIVDAGMNDLIRPALYGAFHRIVPVDGAATETEPITVVGPVCESADFNAEQIPLPKVAEGDLLAIMSAGAYAATMASTYNARPLPPEVLVEGNDYHVVRTRQTYEALFASQVLPPARGARK
jgi:diaminopimelate decarboxylase